MSTPSPRRAWRTRLLYARALASRFRASLAGLAVALVLGTVLFRVTPHAQLDGARPSFGLSLYAAWMALFSQQVLAPPARWYLSLVFAFYPLVGFVLVGEGVVRLGLLMFSRERGEREWMTVMASTYSDHVVLCGLGHLGFRVLQQLVASGVPVVAIEKDASCRFLTEATKLGQPVLVRDVRDDDALIEAGMARARAVIVATNDDMANLEVALDARRMNPDIRVLMRLFDQGLADKLKAVKLIDEAFSTSALAAPVVAQMAR